MQINTAITRKGFWIGQYYYNALKAQLSSMTKGYPSIVPGVRVKLMASTDRPKGDSVRALRYHQG